MKRKSKLYNSRKWREASKRFLRRNPLCKFCAEQGITTKADVTDHIIPHKGDLRLFWDESKNWQPLCFSHHNSTKQRMEAGRPVVQFGVDGMPVPGSDHHWTKEK